MSLFLNLHEILRCNPDVWRFSRTSHILDATHIQMSTTLGHLDSLNTWMEATLAESLVRRSRSVLDDFFYYHTNLCITTVNLARAEGSRHSIQLPFLFSIAGHSMKFFITLDMDVAAQAQSLLFTRSRFCAVQDGKPRQGR